MYTPRIVTSQTRSSNLPRAARETRPYWRASRRSAPPGRRTGRRTLEQADPCEVQGPLHDCGIRPRLGVGSREPGEAGPRPAGNQAEQGKRCPRTRGAIANGRARQGFPRRKREAIRGFLPPVALS